MKNDAPRYPNKINKIAIRSFKENAGILEKPAEHSFQYTADNPISLTMPYMEEPYKYGALLPIFAQNLPEGAIRAYLRERLVKANKDIRFDDMYMLALQFGNAIGHLSFGSPIKQPESKPITLDEVLTYKGKDRIFEDLLDRYYLHGVASGMQPKVLIPATTDDKNIEQRATVQTDEYIVKTFDDDYPLLTVNEYVCMQAAKACGLNPPACFLSEDLRTYAVKRFDITPNGKIGVEDFTVLTRAANTPEAKYQSSYETVMNVTARYTANNPFELRKMYEYIVFCMLIGNGDAHLKNFSLTYDRPYGDVKVSPLYDITHTVIYKDLVDESALKINGNRVWPSHADLVAFGKAFGVVKPERIIEKIADSISDYLKQSEEVTLFDGLRASIERSLNVAKVGVYTSTGYTHRKKKKYE
ncbi:MULTISPECIES: type II toxin-antitoxin system HipA family toxin [Pseudoalteromonas]|uniref:type II toxin-antitoxin system HipA family toxin n=1 Tax=Pseudoalteromonas TaxID=53246 RepID=UPI0015815A78|nr:MULTISPECIES: type II toxin-antitoxin system HipA family toxin [Pseudoalteromonas]MDI4652547.1 type II toxin-antitoxin system HipA family toxin [Pseudoalteromonas shioyasakiensis]NUJ38745.1 type II toxin-antitoxin system HipA family toxin [Pseudoalteromonas sp. 0303]